MVVPMRLLFYFWPDFAHHCCSKSVFLVVIRVARFHAGAPIIGAPAQREGDANHEEKYRSGATMVVTIAFYFFLTRERKSREVDKNMATIVASKRYFFWSFASAAFVQELLS